MNESLTHMIHETLCIIHTVINIIRIIMMDSAKTAVIIRDKMKVVIHTAIMWLVVSCSLFVDLPNWCLNMCNHDPAEPKNNMEPVNKTFDIKIMFVDTCVVTILT